MGFKKQQKAPYLANTFPATQNAANAAMSTTTTVAPTGVPAKMAANIPTNAQKTDNMAEHAVTERKLLNTRIADKAGNITSADIKSDPARFIASTMMTAMMTAISRLYAPVFIPPALAKSSSNVTAKILW